MQSSEIEEEEGISARNGEGRNGIDSSTEVTVIDNPFNKLISNIYFQIFHLDYKKLNCIPSSITAAVFVVVMFAMIILWPYGFMPVVATTLWRYISSAIKIMKTKKVMEKMPYAVEIGIIFLFWLPFAFLCIPFVLVSLLGHLINLCIESIDSKYDNKH